MPIGTIHQLLLVLLVATVTTINAFSRSHKVYIDENTPWEDRAKGFRPPGLDFSSEGLAARDGDEHEEQAMLDMMRDLQQANMLQKAAEVESLYASILLQKAQSAFSAASKLQNKAEDIMSMPSEGLLKDHTKKEKKEQKPRGSRETDIGSESEGEEDDEFGKAQERFSLLARHLHRNPFGREPTNFPRPVHARALEISPAARELYQLGLLSSYLNGVRDNLNGIASPRVLQTDRYEEDDNDEEEEDAEELQPPAYLAGPFRRRGIPEQDDLQEFLERFHKHAQASSDRTKRQRMTPSRFYRTLAALQKIGAE